MLHVNPQCLDRPAPDLNSIGYGKVDRFTGRFSHALRCSRGSSELIGHDGHQVASIIGRKACRCVHHTTRGGVGIDTSWLGSLRAGIWENLLGFMWKVESYVESRWHSPLPTQFRHGTSVARNDAQLTGWHQPFPASCIWVQGFMRTVSVGMCPSPGKVARSNLQQ
jgi:hypothetical protein